MKREGRPGQATTVFVVLAIVFLVLAVSDLPVSTSTYVNTLPSNGTGETKAVQGGWVANILGRGAGSSVRADFRSGLRGWDSSGPSGADWEGGRYLHPGSLRLWATSTSLSNYEFEFMGQIERKSIDWVFRAADFRNYYATKLAIARPGPLPNAGLIRFVVLDGRERERVELPLPLTLERGVDYRVHLSVRGNRFLTSVNGHLVSSWTDTRLSRGGVGFFSEDGEGAMLKWASLSERDSFVSRIVSHFSLLTVPPGASASTDSR